MIAELASMCPENGGYVHWVRHGLGEFPCWISSYNHMLSNICDICVYCCLFCKCHTRSLCFVLINTITASYLETLLPALTLIEVKAIQIGCLVFVTLVNLTKLKELSIICAILTCLVLAPYLIEPFLVMPRLTSNAGFLLKSAPDINWNLFVSSLLWCNQVGC